MADPRRTSALSGLTAEDHPRAENAGIRVRAIEELSKITLRGSEAVARKVAEVSGSGFAEAINSASRAGDVRMSRLGPDEWLLIGLSPADLEGALKGMHHALVDISERLLAIELEGPAAREVLAGACPMDLFTVEPGFASRTVMGKAEIVLECLGHDHFLLHTNRSFLEYLWLLVLEIGREHGVRAA